MLCAFDIETTGVDTERDRIVELAILIPPDERYRNLVNPGCPIPAEATAIHGITDADVADEPPFAKIAKRVQQIVDGKILLTYNGRRFDALILDRELREAGEPGLDLEHVQEIDLYRVWMESESRSLVGALERFGLPAHTAHSAMADTAALMGLLVAIGEYFQLSQEDMLRLSRPADEVDRSGKLRLEGGEIVFTFGKHKGQAVKEHLDYVDWMLGRDFPPDTKRALREILQQR